MSRPSMDKDGDVVVKRFKLPGELARQFETEVMHLDGNESAQLRKIVLAWVQKQRQIRIAKALARRKA